MSVYDFTCNHRQWLHVNIYNTKIISKLLYCTCNHGISAVCRLARVSNTSAGMISRRHFHENSAEFAVLWTFTGQGH